MLEIKKDLYLNLTNKFRSKCFLLYLKRFIFKNCKKIDDIISIIFLSEYQRK